MEGKEIKRKVRGSGRKGGEGGEGGKGGKVEGEEEKGRESWWRGREGKG